MLKFAFFYRWSTDLHALLGKFRRNLIVSYSLEYFQHNLESHIGFRKC